jgi:hypothetical protein
MQVIHKREKIKTCKTAVLWIPIADIFVRARNLVRRFGQKFTQRVHEENLTQLQDARTGTYMRFRLLMAGFMI